MTTAQAWLTGVGVALLVCLYLWSGVVEQRAEAQSAPYQVYKISYGCLYVVTTQGGGAAITVTPSVGGNCQ